MKVTDYRRPDQRSYDLEGPFWISSALIRGVDVQAEGVSAEIEVATIAGASGTPDTFTDSGNGFTAGGFTIATDPIFASGFVTEAANNNYFTLSAVAAGTLTVAETTVVSEGASEVVNICTPRGLVLFSFPHASKRYLIQEVQVELIEAFTAATKITVGLGTIATDAIGAGHRDANKNYYASSDVMLNTDIDAYVTPTDVTIATPAYYGPTGSAWYTAAGLCGSTSPRIITGAATTVPVIYAMVSNGTQSAVPVAITAGQFRIHMQISPVPGK